MKLQYLLLIFLTASIVVSCGNEQTEPAREATMNPEKPQAEIHQTDPGTSDEKPARKAVVVVKNAADYSETFVAELKQSTNFRKFNLRDSLFIVNDQDTILFPTSMKIGEEIKFTGRKDKLAIALTIKRINYTTVSYWVEMVEFGKTSHEQKGTAELSSGFFLGSESVEIDGELYFVDEFNDQSKGDCQMKIRIGERPEGNQLFCKIQKNCNGKIHTINMDNFPALQEK